MVHINVNTLCRLCSKLFLSFHDISITWSRFFFFYTISLDYTHRILCTRMISSISISNGVGDGVQCGMRCALIVESLFRSFPDW